MIKIIEKTIQEISKLSDEKQYLLAVYIRNHLDELLVKAEKEKIIEENNYTFSDLNEETKQAIINIEEKNNLTVCENEQDLYNQLGLVSTT